MYTLNPIGRVICDQRELYQLPNQPGRVGGLRARIELEAGCNYEQALEDLAGFERIWVVFVFDKARNWKPKVMPPRGEAKRGLFATRSPHRPNPIGMSCVELLGIKGRVLEIGDHDLLDGTPVLDIKPYVPYADAFPAASAGWLGEVSDDRYTLVPQGVAAEKINWLQHNGVDLLGLSSATLGLSPYPRSGKRITQLEGDSFELAVKTWRMIYRVEAESVVVEDVRSGYDAATISGEKSSRWDDVPLHRDFLSHFSDSPQ